MNKSVLFSLLLAFFISSFSLSAQENLVIDKVVAKVGGEIVLLSEVEGQFNYLKDQQNSDITDDYKCQILENLIAERVLVHHAKLDSVEVLESEVEATIDYKLQSILRQMGGDEALFERYYGKTIDQVREDQKLQTRHQLLAERLQSQLINSVDITPKEVVQFFSMIPTDSLPYFNAEVEIGEIIMVPKVNPVEREKAREKLESIRNQIINEGADFAEMAKKYSQDYESARKGGDLGRQARGTFVPAFEAAVFSLKNGEMSDLVETTFGFHLILLDKRIGNSVKSSHILIKPEITSADIELTRNKLDSIANLIAIDSLSFEVAVRKFGYDKVDSYHNNGRMKNNLTGNTFYETKDLSPDIYFAIEGMEVGDVSETLEFTDRTGEEMFRVIQLQSRSKPHRANLEQDYSKIQLFAKQNKKNEYLNNWIQERMKKTFITIDGYYHGCPGTLQQWVENSQP